MIAANNASSMECFQRREGRAQLLADDLVGNKGLRTPNLMQQIHKFTEDTLGRFSTTMFDNNTTLTSIMWRMEASSFTLRKM